MLFQVLASTIEGCSDENLEEKLTDVIQLLVSEEVCQASEKVRGGFQFTRK